ncbi:MAG: hypothetical protein ACYDAE_25720 [Steroidobacteraceae bacterium]
MLAQNVGHLCLPFPGDVDECPEAIDDQVHAVGLKLHLRERPGASQLLGDVVQGAPNDGELDVLFAPDCRENACLDQVQERKRTPLVAVKLTLWNIEASYSQSERIDIRKSLFPSHYYNKALYLPISA